eukprot:COSAG01_NODE_7741_length_3076_cov_11.159221_8_plen_97_part_00
MLLLLRRAADHTTLAKPWRRAGCRCRSEGGWVRTSRLRAADVADRLLLGPHHPRNTTSRASRLRTLEDWKLGCQRSGFRTSSSHHTEHDTEWRPRS